MPVFAYVATDFLEHRQNGTLIASTPSEGRQSLRDRGLTIVSFSPALRKPWIHSFARYGQRRRLDRVAETARYLSLLLRAGIPLAESLDVLSRQSDRSLATVLQALRDRIQGGDGFAEALAAYPDWFDEVFLGAVRVGELSGNLDESLAQLAEHMRVDQSLRSELANALTYPFILALVGVGVVLFLMSYVVPQLLNVLAVSGRPLPTSTLLLKGFSDVLLTHWVILLATTIGVVLVLAWGFHRPRIRSIWQLFLLGLPVVGPLIRKSIIAQFAQRMHLLLQAGIPFVDAVQTVARQSRNLILKDELHGMVEAVESGSDIARCMQDSKVFPPVVAHIVAVGQDSGELVDMLSDMRTRFESEVRLAMKRFTSVLEPILIVIMAAVIGFVVFACLMPIWETTRGIL